MAQTVVYHIRQKIPFRTYYRYCTKVNHEAEWKSRKQTMILAAVMFAAALIGWLFQITFVVLFCSIMGVLYLVFNNVFWRQAVRRQYKKNKMISTGEQRLAFYKDSFSVKWEKERGEYPYKKLMKIDEDDDAFYLMVNEHAGQIVMKKACDEDLKHFLERLAARHGRR